MIMMLGVSAWRQMNDICAGSQPNFRGLRCKGSLVLFGRIQPPRTRLDGVEPPPSPFPTTLSRASVSVHNRRLCTNRNHNFNT